MAVLSIPNYLVSSTQAITGVFGAVSSGTAITQNTFQPLVTFPFPVEIIGMTLNRATSAAPTAAVTLTAGYAPIGTSAAGGVVVCSATLTEPQLLGGVTFVIQDNGVTNTASPPFAKPIIVPVGNSIVVLVSNHDPATSLYNGWTILYRPVFTAFD